MPGDDKPATGDTASQQQKVFSLLLPSNGSFQVVNSAEIPSVSHFLSATQHDKPIKIKSTLKGTNDQLKTPLSITLKEPTTEIKQTQQFK